MPKDKIYRMWSRFCKNVIPPDRPIDKKEKQAPIMKQLILWTILILPVFGLAQQAAMPGFAITGSVTGLSEGSPVYLTDANNPTDTLARTQVKAGQFLLAGHLSDPNLYDLNFGSAQKKTLLFIGNDQISIAGSVEDLKSLTVKGSSTHDDFMSFQQHFNPLFARLNELGKLYNSPEAVGKMDSLSRLYKKLVASVE